MIWFKNNLSTKRFSDWIASYHGPLFKHALWMTGNQDVAADMVQEAYYQAWISMGNLRDETKVLSWLLTILRRVIHKEQRSKYRHTETLAQLYELDGGKFQDDCFRLIQIYSMLEQISPVQRDTFLLHYLHGFKYEEISEILEIPLGTVMSRLARTRELLSKLRQNDTAKVIQFAGTPKEHAHDR